MWALWIFIGLVVGATFGAIMMSLFIVGSNSDEKPMTKDDKENKE